MKSNYKKTMYACYIGYIVQAIVNNFVPLLFVTFQNSYQIPLSKITALVTVNFIIQLLIDMLSAKFIDKIGYRASVIIAHIVSAAGLILLTILPELFSDAYTGIMASVAVYAVGGGLIEVLISPIMEACPTKNKEKTMSLLHSFYCWGHMGVVLLSTVFFFGCRHSQLENSHLDLGDYSPFQYRSFYESAHLFFTCCGRTRFDSQRPVFKKSFLDFNAYDGVRRRV